MTLCGKVELAETVDRIGPLENLGMSKRAGGVLVT